MERSKNDLLNIHLHLYSLNLQLLLCLLHILKARKDIVRKINSTLNISIEDHIVFEDTADPRSIEAETHSFKGALYGTSSNSKESAFFRHPNFSKDIKGLYFCGGSVHPGGGIPLVLSSAKIVDDLISEEYEKK